MEHDQNGAHHDHHGSHHTIMDPTTILANITTTVATTVASMINSTLNPDLGHEAHGNPIQALGQEVHNAHGDHVGHDGMMPGMGGMDMYFKFGLGVTVLFKEWNVTTVGGMVGSVIGVMILAILYEGIKFLREYLFRKSFTRLSYSTCAVTGTGGCESNGADLHKVTENRMFGLPHLLQTALHVVQIVLSYFLMLIFMTFNLWLCFAVLIGSAIGYFCFGWRKSTIVDISDHCH